MSAPADVDRPGTWKKYRAGLCDGCWAGCCTMPVEVTAQDLFLIGVLDEYEFEESPRKAVQKLQKMGVIKSYRAGTGLFMLERKQGRDCVYLGEDRRCTIYDKRPQVCRKFPEQMGRRVGYCPAGKF